MTKKQEMEQFDSGSLGELVPGEILEQYAPMIGELILTFSELEHTLNGEVVKMICARADTVGYAVIGGLRYGQKIELFKNLFGPTVHSLNNKELEKVFDDLVSRLVCTSEYRNNVAHAEWCNLDADSHVRVKIKSDKLGTMSVFKKITMEVLEEQIEEIKSLSEDLYDFYDRVMQPV
ncbi:MAG: hypothetical protein WBC83_03340 [Minisyncoccia bacterium]